MIHADQHDRVAHSINESMVPVEQLVVEGRLKEVPGAGEAIIKKIAELVTTGRLGYYEKLKESSREGRGLDAL